MFHIVWIIKNFRSAAKISSAPGRSLEAERDCRASTVKSKRPGRLPPTALCCKMSAEPMHQQEKDEILAAQLPGILKYHQQMLGDGLRNKLLSEAVRRHVTPRTRFLEIGAGAGVWAILAAVLGARKVVAIEIEESLIPMIYRHAQENGVADRIEIVHGNADDVRLRGKFDVVVGEVFGQDAFGEATLRSFINIRERFLAPGGVLIPQKMEMYAVPVKIQNPVREAPAGIPLKCDFVNALRLNYPQEIPFAERARVEFLGERQKLFEADFRTVAEAHSLKSHAAVWQLDNISEVNAFAVFSRSVYTDGIELDSYDSQSWSVAKYEFKPFAQTAGEIKFTIMMDAKKGSWSVGLPSHPEAKAQSFSPVFAFARMKMALETTPRRRVEPEKRPR
jgi:SAM-dependent methyltransferase